MVKIFFLLSFLVTGAYAQLDLNLAASGRSYPSLGGSIYMESGWNYTFWEKDQNLLYGLIRPAIYFDSSLVINTYGAKLGFYPISFAGIELGKETTNSQYEDFTYYDCSEVACKGTMDKSFITYKLGLSAGPIVTSGMVTQYQAKYDYDKANKPVAEFLYATLADPDTDSITFSRYIVGLKALGGFIGLIADYAHTQKTTQTFNSNYLLYGFRTDLGSLSFGAGNLTSDEVDPSAVIYFRWSYWPLPTKLLF